MTIDEHHFIFCFIKWCMCVCFRLQEKLRRIKRNQEKEKQMALQPAIPKKQKKKKKKEMAALKVGTKL